MAEHAAAASTVRDLLAGGPGLDPEGAAMAVPDSFGGWFDLTAAEFAVRVRGLAKGFAAAGLHRGDAIAVLCSPRFESTLVDLAAAILGLVVVPLAPGATQDSLSSLLDETRSRAVVVETARDFVRIDELQGDLPLVADVWQIGLGDLDKLAATGREISDDELDELAARVTGDDVAVVLDGVRLTQAALVARARGIASALEGETGADRSTLQILPTTDVHARVTALVAVATGTRLGHLADPARLVETLGSFRPTLLVAYPSTLHAIDGAVHERAEATGRATALRQALEVALDYSEAQSHGAVPRGLKTRFAVADALVLRGIRKAAGGRLRTVVTVSSDESVSPRLRHLMRALDVRCLEGFGDVSTAGLVTLERQGDAFERPEGSVGGPLLGVEVTVGDDGAVSVRGAGIGAARTGEGHPAVEADGWLGIDRSGSLDDEGRLVLDGRAG